MEHVLNPNSANVLSRLRSAWRDRRRGHAHFKAQKINKSNIVEDGDALAVCAKLNLLWISSGLSRQAFYNRLTISLSTCRSAMSLANGINKARRPISDTTLAGFAELFGCAKAAIVASYDSDDGLESFLSWARARPLKPVPSTELLTRVEYYGDGRKPAEKKILAFLNNNQSVTPLLVVRQGGMTDGLRAMATRAVELSRSKEGPRYPICYIPVGRDPADGTRNTFDDLLSHLAAFYRSEPLQGARRPSSPEERRRWIEYVRMAMAAHPSVLLFGVYARPQSTVPDLAEFNDDDSLVRLINELVHPRIPLDGYPGDASKFCKTKIVVFADGGFPAPGFLPVEVVDAPYPPDGRLEAIFRERGLSDPTRLAKLGAKWSEMKSDTAVLVADFLFSHGVEVETTGGSTEALVGVLVETLKEEDPLALISLRFVALAGCSLRETTLERLLGRLRQTLDPSTDRHWLLGDVSLSGISNSIAKLEGLIAKGEDAETIIHRDPVFADDTKTSIDCQTHELRRRLVDNLNHTEPTRLVARMHRLIAEESLAQHTAAQRYATPTDSLEPRQYRWLCRALYHGFLSVQNGPEIQDLSLHDIRPRVLPTDNAEAYKRLYAVFVRNLLDGRPHWDFTRTVGRDRTKLDIAVLASSPNTARIKAGQHYLIESRESADISTMLFQLEQYCSIARSAYHTHEIEKAKSGIESGSSLIDLIKNEKIEYQWRKHLFRLQLILAKCDLDIEMLERSEHYPHKVKESANRSLNIFGFESTAWLPRLDVVAIKELDLPKSPVDKFVADITKGASAEAVAGWSDLLCRRAEIEVLGVEAQKAPVDGLAEYTRAFVYYFAAERLKRRAFQLAPFDRYYVPNGHSTRVMIRTALRLVRIHDQSNEATADREFLVHQARRHIDLLTRYYARYSTERASLLILEATFQRVVEGRPEVAFQLLSLADEAMFATVDRPRVRLRLTLERGKALRELARAHADSRTPFDSQESLELERRPAVAYFNEAATLEAHRLKEMATRSGIPFWETLADKAMNAVV